MSGAWAKAYGYGNCYRRSNGTVGCRLRLPWQMGDGRTVANYGNRSVSGVSNVAESVAATTTCAPEMATAWSSAGLQPLWSAGRRLDVEPQHAGGGEHHERRRGLVAGGTGWHSCAAQRGTVSCWGRNSYGQMGTGASGGNATTPVNVIGAVAGDVGQGSATNPAS